MPRSRIGGTIKSQAAMEFSLPKHFLPGRRGVCLCFFKIRRNVVCLDEESPSATLVPPPTTPHFTVPAALPRHLQRLIRFPASPRNPLRRVRSRAWLGPVVFALAASPLSAQTVSTVREVEFRSRWSNYHVDQPQVEAANTTQTDEERGIGPLLRSLFRTGPIILRGAVTTGWEFSNERFRNAQIQMREPGKSSFFVAPAVAVSYDRAMGPWTVSFRYSAGYLRYLEDNYASSTNGGAGASGGLSQTTGLDIARHGSRLAIRSNTAASTGTGYDVERDGQTYRATIAEALFAEYSLTEFLHAGINASAGYDSFSDPGGGSDTSRTYWAASLYGEYVLTGKTTVRIEFGAGHENQLAGGQSAFERTYYQALLRATWQPTAKLTLTPAVGVGLLDQTGSATQTPDGLRTVYSLAVDYTPTEKTVLRLYAGVEGTSARPEFSLALRWHPREDTVFNLSIYQQSGLSNVVAVQSRTTRGALASIQQRFFQRIDTGLTVGWEQEETDDTSALGIVNEDPYYFLSASAAWQINSWLTWQAQSVTSSRRSSAATVGAGNQTRASVSLRLTF